MSAERRTVRVELGSRAYDVHIQRGGLRTLGASLRSATGATRVALVTDDTVWSNYGERAFSALLASGFRVTPVTVPPGEGSKSWDQAGAVLERFATAGMGREDVVLALGGGVVGDLAGFCAAVYMRGIAFAQAPTTLLSQVDSSVGGKTGVDLAAGKNLAGAFWQPIVVVADTETLQTLPEAERRSGLTEMAKTAILEGGEHYAWMLRNAERLRAGEPDATAEGVERAVSFKAKVVAADERESGARECLNLGHTLGHALENVAGYGAMTHGDAVAEGIRFAADVARETLDAAEDVARAQDELLDALGLASGSRGCDPGELVRAMGRDKKARDGSVRMVLMRAIGQWEVHAVEQRVLLETLAARAARDREAG